MWICGGISGGHINPVVRKFPVALSARAIPCVDLSHSFPDGSLQVTICAAMFRKFPWKKVPMYILGQVLGAFFGSLFVYADYFSAISLFEGGNGIRTVPGTASLFASYAVSFRLVALIKQP